MKGAINMRIHFKLFVIGLVLAIGAAGCGPQLIQVAGLSGPTVWIDKPLPESSVPVAPVEVLSHASSPDGIMSFELSVDGEVVATNDAPPEAAGDSLVYMTQAWIPDMAGRFMLSVRAMDGNGEYGPTTSVYVNVGEVEAAPPEADEPAAPPEDDQVCTYTAAVNLFCRIGPGSDYEPGDSMTPGQMAEVVGMSEDGNYWYVIGPNNRVVCTVPMSPDFGSTSGVCEPMPVFTPIPLPTDTPEATPTNTASPVPTSTPTVTPIPPPS